MRKLLSLLLILLLLPVRISSAEIQPMGRYVENSIALPMDIFTLRMSAADDGTPMMIGTSQDGLTTYVYDEPNWMKMGVNELPEGWQLFDVAQRENETYALMFQAEREVYEPHVLRLIEGQFVDMNLDFGGSYPIKIAVSENGKLIAQSPEGDLLVFDTEAGAMLHRYGGLGGAMAVQGADVFAVSKTNRSVMQYDLVSGELVREMQRAPITGGDLIASDGQSLFLANSGGVYRIALGGALWEQLIAGNLTSLCLPSVILTPDLIQTNMTVDAGNIYMLVDRDESHQLLKYHFDAATDSLPHNELRAYTMRENPALVQTAAVFQKQNPDYAVSITVLQSDDAGVTWDDAIRALNTELLSGGGPDILLLDGMPISSYAGKGVLLDLSQLIGEMELVSSVFEPLRKEGKLFAAPTTCYIPAMMGSAIDMERAQTLDDLAQVSLPWRTKQGFFSLLLPSSYGAWLNADGQLDEAAFAQFLAAVDAIHQRSGVDINDPYQKGYLENGVLAKGKRDMMDGNGGYMFDIWRYIEEKTAAFPFMLGDLVEDRFPLTALEDMGGMLSWLPGQADHPYAPSGMMGINARSAQSDAALAFVRTALSEEVQGLHGIGGLPVNRKAMNAFIENDLDMSMGYAFGDPVTDETIGLYAKWPDEPLRTQIASMQAQVKTPYLPDATLIEMIKRELTPFFEGKMDAQAATQAVANKVRAYLAE